ncbi:uncharacterized protein UDID_01762 [Ustilago sp. UG-2017a]|nr:uncharacterized protein UDID_01762 [Ustilago sp. UG-2017a]
MVGIVNLRGDKLAYESLYWDQANALVQLGLLDPIKSSLKEGVKLPIAGDEVAQKILHPYGLPSNELMPNWSESEGKAVAEVPPSLRQVPPSLRHSSNLYDDP